MTRLALCLNAILQINIVIIVALGLILSALMFTLIQCYKKAFFDDVFYRKYRHFWLRLGGGLNYFNNQSKVIENTP